MNITELLFNGPYSAMTIISSTPYQQRIIDTQRTMAEIKERLAIQLDNGIEQIAELTDAITAVIEAYMLHAFSVGIKTGFELSNELNKIDIN